MVTPKKPDTVRHEPMALSLQVLGIVLIGAIVTYATDQLQQAAEARRRLDERVAEFLGEMIDAYNGVKRVRRSLEAQTMGERPEAAAIDRETYTQQLGELSGYQVEFESLRDRALQLQVRLAGAVNICAAGSERDGPSGGRTDAAPQWSKSVMKVAEFDGPIQKHLAEVERHLNTIIEEYQQSLHLVPVDGTLLLSALREKTQPSAVLPVFIDDTWCFRCCVSRHVHAVRKCLEAHLLRA